MSTDDQDHKNGKKTTPLRRQRSRETKYLKEAPDCSKGHQMLLKIKKSSEGGSPGPPPRGGTPPPIPSPGIASAHAEAVSASGACRLLQNILLSIGNSGYNPVKYPTIFSQKLV